MKSDTENNSQQGTMRIKKETESESQSIAVDSDHTKTHKPSRKKKTNAERQREYRQRLKDKNTSEKKKRKDGPQNKIREKQNAEVRRLKNAAAAKVNRERKIKIIELEIQSQCDPVAGTSGTIQYVPVSSAESQRELYKKARTEWETDYKREKKIEELLQSGDKQPITKNDETLVLARKKEKSEKRYRERLQYEKRCSKLDSVLFIKTNHRHDTSEELNSATTRDDENRSKNKVDQFKQHIIRSVARLMLHEKVPEDEMWAKLKKETGHNCELLWGHMRSVALRKLKRLLAAEDRVDFIASMARMTVTDWLLFDLVLVHEKTDFIGKDVRRIRKGELKPLTDLFSLVQKYEIEGLSGDALAQAWTEATLYYNSQGHHVSPMLLQKRWCQLKETTRNRFYQFWVSFRGNVKPFAKASCGHMPSVLQIDIATRFKEVVTSPVMEWEEMIQKGLIILSEEFDARLLQAKENYEKAPDIVLIEPTIETVDLEYSNTDTSGNKQNDTENVTAALKTVVKTEPIEIKDEDLSAAQNLTNSVPVRDDDDTYESKVGHTEDLDIKDNDLFLLDNALKNDEHVISDSDNVISNTINNKITPTIDEIGVYPEINARDVISNARNENVPRYNDDTTTCEEKNHVSDDRITKTIETLPQITSVYGNVDVKSDNVFNINEISTVITTPIAKSSSNDAVDIVTPTDDVNANREYLIIEYKSKPQEEINKNQQDFPIAVKEEARSSVNDINDKTCKNALEKLTETPVSGASAPNSAQVKSEGCDPSLGELPSYLKLHDYGVELVDGEIAHVDKKMDYNIKMGEIKTDDDEKRCESKAEAAEVPTEDTCKIDPKRLLYPIVYTTRLDQMGVLDEPYQTVNDKHLLDIILAKSKPLIKKAVNFNYSNKKNDIAPTNDNISTWNAVKDLSIKTPYPPCKLKEIRPAVSSLSKTECVNPPVKEALLTMDTLNTMLNLITQEKEEIIRKKALVMSGRKSRKPQPDHAMQIIKQELSNDDVQVISEASKKMHPKKKHPKKMHPEKMQPVKMQPEDKQLKYTKTYKPKKSKYCCWALSKMHAIIKGKRARLHDGVDECRPICKCCCLDELDIFMRNKCINYSLEHPHSRLNGSAVQNTYSVAHVINPKIIKQNNIKITPQNRPFRISLDDPSSLDGSDKTKHSIKVPSALTADSIDNVNRKDVLPVGAEVSVSSTVNTPTINETISTSSVNAGPSLVHGPLPVPTPRVFNPIPEPLLQKFRNLSSKHQPKSTVSPTKNSHHKTETSPSSCKFIAQTSDDSPHRKIIIDGSQTCSLHKSIIPKVGSNEKKIFLTSGQISQKSSQSPILLGKSKILLTNVKLPPVLKGAVNLAPQAPLVNIIPKEVNANIIQSHKDANSEEAQTTADLSNAIDQQNINKISADVSTKVNKDESDDQPIAIESNTQNNTIITLDKDTRSNSENHDTVVSETETSIHKVAEENKYSNKSKNIVANLVEISGLSAEDVTPALAVTTQPEAVHTPAASDEASQPQSAQAPLCGLPPNMAARLSEFSLIMSFAELKYACMQNGLFFKLDLETGSILPTNICIKKLGENKTVKTKVPASVTIDLTDDNVPENKSKPQKSPSTPPRPLLIANQKSNSIHKYYQKKSVLPNILRDTNESNVHDVKKIESSKNIQKCEPFRLKKKQDMFYSDCPNKEEYLGSLGSDGESRKREIQSDCSSDEEPLSKVAKTMRC